MLKLVKLPLQCDVPWASLSLVILVTLDFGSQTILLLDLLMHYELPNSTPGLYALICTD